MFSVMVWGDECLCWQQRKGIPKVLQIFQLFLANSDPPFYTPPKVPGLKGFFGDISLNSPQSFHTAKFWY